MRRNNDRITQWNGLGQDLLKREIGSLELREDEMKMQRGGGG